MIVLDFTFLEVLTKKMSLRMTFIMFNLIQTLMAIYSKMEILKKEKDYNLK
jgi:hypothetical protein